MKASLALHVLILFIGLAPSWCLNFGLSTKTESSLNLPTVFVKIERTTTTTIFKTTTKVLLSGTFAASYNVVQILNKKGQLPQFFMTAYDQMETYSTTWRTIPETLTTTTQIYVELTVSNGTVITPEVPPVTFRTQFI